MEYLANCWNGSYTCGIARPNTLGGVLVSKNTAWLEAQIKKASEEGNFVDWQNYTDMLKRHNKSLEDNKLDD